MMFLVHCVHRRGWVQGGAEAAPGPTNHKEFLRQLKGLDVFGVLDVHGLELTAGDLCILGQTLPNLRGEDGAVQHARVVGGPCA